MWQPDLQPVPCVVAHPAAVTLALLLLRAGKAGAIRSATATVFQPASERGQKGMDELHQQTINLLSFQPLPKDIFDTQVAFNLVARYGSNSKLSLDTLEARIRSHYRELTGVGAPEPAVMALQPPVFHGHALTIFLEMAQSVDAERLAEALAGEHVNIAGADDDSQPSNVNAAGQGNILVSLKTESSRPNGIWLWAVGDNLRVAAITAVECAESMIATRPLGQIQ
jgi:aspartate-semialdehyde dehydrogenase